MRPGRFGGYLRAARVVVALIGTVPNTLLLATLVHDRWVAFQDFLCWKPLADTGADPAQCNVLIGKLGNSTTRAWLAPSEHLLNFFSLFWGERILWGSVATLPLFVLAAWRRSAPGFLGALLLTGTLFVFARMRTLLVAGEIGAAMLLEVVLLLLPLLVGVSWWAAAVVVRDRPAG